MKPLDPGRSRRGDRTTNELLEGKGQNDVQLAASADQRLRPQNVRPARQGAVGVTRMMLVKLLGHSPRHLIFGVGGKRARLALASDAVPAVMGDSGAG